MNAMDMPLPEPMNRDQHLGVTQLYFDADQLHARDAQWRAIVAAEVAKEREKCAALCDRFAARDMHPAECAADIRAGSPGTAPPSEPV